MECSGCLPRRWPHRSCILRKVILVSSLIGFIVQISYVSSQYFRYTTTTDVTFSQSHYVNPYSTAVCVRYQDIIDKGKLSLETGIKLKAGINLAELIANDVLLTVDQIFKYTPAADQALESCVYREDNWLIRERTSPTDCYNWFDVSRFFTSEFMCYRIAERSARILETRSITQAKHQMFRVFEVAFNSNFKHVLVVNPIIWFESRLPYISRSYAKPVSFVSNGVNTVPITNMLYVSPVDTYVSLLEAPFDTKCLKSPRNPFSMVHRCLIDAYFKIGLAPGSEMIESSNQFVPVSNREYANETIMEILRKIFMRCQKNFMFTECHVTFTQTIVDSVKAFNKTFAVALYVSSQAETHTKAQPSMTFVDYFSFMCSCFGTWFGLSFLSLDPSRLWKKTSNHNSAFRIHNDASIRPPLRITNLSLRQRGVRVVYH